MKFVTTLILVAALAACSPLGIKTDGQKIAIACASASASIKVLTVANDMGKLDDDQQYMASVAISTIAPVCISDNPPTLDDVKREAFLAAIAALELAATQATTQATTGAPK